MDIPAPQLSPDVEKLIFDAKGDLLDCMSEQIGLSNMSLEESEEAAADFLDMLPIVSKEDLLDKLRILTTKFPMLLSVYKKYSSSQEEEKRQELLKAMAEELRNGNLQAAVDVAAGGNH